MIHRILLCDDEEHILHAAQIKLARAGFAIECAHDGEQAWEAILRNCPHLLVTDCQMPRLNGLDLVRRIRQDDRTRHLHVLMLTAKGLELSHAELQRQLGILAVISKPFSPRELLRRIDKALGIVRNAAASAHPGEISAVASE